jgi:predicted AAA+ superfamily ATPase
MRIDTGHLWENFIIAERIKYNANRGIWVNSYFWRTHQKQEIDYLEEKGGSLFAYEFKWKRIKKRIPKIFLNAYPGSKAEIIDKDNFDYFIGL